MFATRCCGRGRRHHAEQRRRPLTVRVREQTRTADIDATGHVGRCNLRMNLTIKGKVSAGAMVEATHPPPRSMCSPCWRSARTVELTFDAGINPNTGLPLPHPYWRNTLIKPDIFGLFQ